ncbi:transmembrane protein 79-like isoform X2 [Phycodurus eques]|uniref:transmembrane protein 79-like isoform X2 n=1 Tax=Phycodurus eques TaxID=693459 RepID=UPI002ACD6A13|nr:transmembrane protein 79-like isoform X2 [Phycodurus eques]
MRRRSPQSPKHCGKQRRPWTPEEVSGNGAPGTTGRSPQPSSSPSWCGGALCSCPLMPPCWTAPPSGCSTCCAAPYLLPRLSSWVTSTSVRLSSRPSVCLQLICPGVRLSGWLAMGVRRVRFGIVRPLLDDMEAAALEDLGVHAKYTRDSVSLFLMYFLQLVIMAMYLSQEQLKLVPLLAIVFALGRSVYWVAAAFGSSVRAFGSGLSFLPGLVMAVANLVFIFNVESSALFFSSPRHPQTLSPVGKQRFWG